MADEPDKPQAISDPVILRLVKETGVTKTEAHELVAFWAEQLAVARPGSPIAPSKSLNPQLTIR